MKEYSIEGNIDFYTELFKSLDNDEDKNIDDNNLCLITNEPLIEKYVTLSCGHKFNYIPLYNDLVNHKIKFNILEGNSSQLRGNENRCPYCRNKQNELLPCYEEFGLKKVPGVNIEAKCINVNYTSKFKSCQYLTPNPIFDPNCENPQEIGYLSNCKFLKCYSVHGSQIINIDDNKYYCYKHKKLVTKEYKKAALDKAKEEKQKEKEKAKKEKEDAKQKANEEKQKAKEEKQKAKEDLKKMNVEEKTKNNKSKTNKKSHQVVIEITDNIEEENVIIGDINLCSEILKTGANKGKQCNIIIFKDCLCKRHYNLKNK
jgi:hypothetical protein